MQPAQSNPLPHALAELHLEGSAALSLRQLHALLRHLFHHTRLSQPQNHSRNYNADPSAPTDAEHIRIGPNAGSSMRISIINTVSIEAVSSIISGAGISRASSQYYLRLMMMHSASIIDSCPTASNRPVGSSPFPRILRTLGQSWSVPRPLRTRP